MPRQPPLATSNARSRAARRKPPQRDARKKKAAPKASAAAPPAAASGWQLPAHWPPFSTPQYYAVRMASMPAGAIAADWSKQQPHNSYSPLFWYQDQARVCTACSAPFVFTKEQQQKWYEEYGIPIYAGASRCAGCRRELRQRKQAQKRHMEDMASRPTHPNEAFFRSRIAKKA